jgi:hypothetical protein
MDPSDGEYNYWLSPSPRDCPGGGGSSADGGDDPDDDADDGGGDVGNGSDGGGGGDDGDDDGDGCGDGDDDGGGGGDGDDNPDGGMAARQRPPSPPTPKICNCCKVSEDIKIFYITGEGYMCKHCCTNESGRARRCRCCEPLPVLRVEGGLRLLLSNLKRGGVKPPGQHGGSVAVGLLPAPMAGIRPRGGARVGVTHGRTECPVPAA